MAAISQQEIISDVFMQTTVRALIEIKMTNAVRCLHHPINLGTFLVHFRFVDWQKRHFWSFIFNHGMRQSSVVKREKFSVFVTFMLMRKISIKVKAGIIPLSYFCASLSARVKLDLTYELAN